MGPADVVRRGRRTGLQSMGRASFTVGLYLVTGKSPDKGYLVFVNPAA
jgi:hypothetical protein